MPTLSVCLLLLSAAPPAEAKPAPVTIFVARKVVTMERRQPFVTAVAVADGRIVATGTLDEVQEATKGRNARIDRTFADKVLLPGLVACIDLADFAPDLRRLRVLHQTGATTIADLSGWSSSEKEVATLKEALDGKGRIVSLGAVFVTAADAARDGKRPWEAGRRLVVRGEVDDALDALAALQKAKRRDDHRFAVISAEKWSATRCERLADMNGVAAVDPRDGSRAGSLIRAKVPVALRSAKEPAGPLLLASALSGDEDKVTVLAALRAITLDAAFVLGQEKEIGSVAPGKQADFTVLDQDPLAVSLKQLKDVPVWGTVLEGRKHPVAKASGWDDRPKRLANQPSASPMRHVGLLGDDLDPRRSGKCDPSCPCRGGPRSKTLPINPNDPRRGR